MTFKFKDKSLKSWRFFADLSEASTPTLVESENEGDKNVYESEIPIFREGDFKHPWYGDLEFTVDYLNQLVNNHNLEVLPQQVSFDKDHRPGDGAFAWVKVKGLKIKDIVVKDRTLKALFADIEYTPEGYEEVVLKKKYKYFSSEIDNNYTNHEMVANNNGEKIIVYHGPTLVGGGFTNRPFIPNLGTVFSKNEFGEQEEQDLVMVKTWSEDSAVFGTLASISEPSKHVSEPEVVEEVQGENEMKFSELLKNARAFSGVERREYLLSNLSKIEDTDDQELIKSMVANEEKVELSQRLAEEATRRADNAALKLSEKDAQIVSLSSQVLEAKQASYQNQALAFSEKLKADNFAPAVADEVKEILLSLNVESRGHKFSLDGSDAPVGLMDILDRIFSKMPEDLRVPTKNEFSTTTPEATEPVPATKVDEELTPEAIELNRRSELFEQKFGFAPTPDQSRLLNEDGVIDMSKTQEK